MCRIRRIPAALLATALLALTASSSTHAATTSGTWNLLAGPMDPPPMYGHAAIHDGARHRMVFIDGARTDELWCLSLPAQGRSEWTRIHIGGTEYPGQRHCFTAVLDSAGDRAIVFGGYREWMTDYDDTWALSLGEAPRWTRIGTAGEGPHSRWKHTAVFDPIRRRMIVFGGYAYSGGQLADTWALELAGTPAWNRLAVGGRAPLHREGMGAVYDPWNDRMVMFGGWVEGDISAYPPPYYISDETWTLALADPVSWDSLALPVRAGARQTFATAVDLEHHAMIVSGGETWQTGRECSDTWALQLQGPPQWTQLPTSGTGPGAVSWHAGAYAPERGSFIQYGGTRTAVQNECFELGLATDQWTRVFPPAPDPRPIPQGGAVWVPDPTSDHPILLGGVGRHDLWSFDESVPSWTRLATAGTTTATWIAFDAKRRRLIAIGGGLYLNRGALLNDLWSMSLDEPRTWTPLVAQGPTPVGRTRFGLVYDPERDRLVLYGGINWGTGGSRQANDLADVWELSLAEPRWRQLQAEGAPGRRGGTTLLYDAARDRLLLLGGFRSGYSNSTPVLDTWFAPLGQDSLVWSPLGPPLPVDGPVVLDPTRDRLISWWGDERVSFLPLANPLTWLPATVSGTSPTWRFESAVRFDERSDRLLVYGGGVYGGFPSYSDAGDFYALDLSRRVRVEVRPGKDVGTVRPGGKDLVEVAIFASASFAPESVLVGTVELAGARAIGTARGHVSEQPRDVDRDGRIDLVLYFASDSLRLLPSDTVAVLLGETPAGAIFGRAHVRVVAHSHPIDRKGGGSASTPSPPFTIHAESPAVAGLSLRWSLPEARPARLEIFDVTGRRVLARALSPVEGVGTLQLSAGMLRPGLFLLRLDQGGRVVTGRAIVLR